MEKVIHLSKVEHLFDSDGKEYRLLHGIDGYSVKVKAGQGGVLKKKWPLLDELIGHDINLHFEDYHVNSGKNAGKSYPFVADFDVPVHPATKEGSTPSMEKALDAQKPPQKAQETPVDNKLDSRTRGIALSYAVDLVAGNAIRIDDLINCAHTLEMWMSNEFTPVYKADWINQYLKK
jgi:hypothetical protein